jgi:hypothetical protein
MSDGNNSFDDFIAAFTILKKYNNKGFVVDANHDVIYANVSTVSPDDEIALEDLGWHKDEDLDCWACFT